MISQSRIDYLKSEDLEKVIQNQLPDDRKAFSKAVNEEISEDIDNSGYYYPSIIILPLTPEGEEYLQLLVEEYAFRYGCFSRNFKYEGETYNIIVVNND